MESIVPLIFLIAAYTCGETDVQLAVGGHASHESYPYSAPLGRVSIETCVGEYGYVSLEHTSSILDRDDNDFDGLNIGWVGVRYKFKY